MAQRILNCPSCNARVEVPVNYFRANIACFQCGTQIDRRTGALASTGQAAPPIQPQYGGNPQFAPNPQAAQPQQYAQSPRPAQPQQYAQNLRPAQPQQYAPNPQAAGPQPYPQYYPPQYAGQMPAKKRFPVWAILLLILGPGLFVGIMAVAMIPVLTSGGVSETGEWHTHSSAVGGYEVQFPVRPTEKTEKTSTPLGYLPLHSAYCQPGRFHFEAAWYNMGPGPEEGYYFDYEEGARGVAEAKNGRVTSQERYIVQGHPGSIAVITQPGNLRSTCMMVRKGNRVYVLIVENHQTKHQAIVNRFVQSFKFLDAGNLR